MRTLFVNGLRQTTRATTAVLLLACGDAATVVSAPPAPAPKLVGLAIAPDSLVMMLGTGGSFGAVWAWSDGSRVLVPSFPVTVRWSSSNDEIVTISSIGEAVAVGPGRAQIIVVADGRTAFASVMVPAPKAIGSSDALVIQSFTMNEHQYESAPDAWFYAPQLRALAAPGRAVSVLRLKFWMPGDIYPIKFSCGGQLSAGVPRDLNGEIYGDPLFEIGPSLVQVSGVAKAEITFIDDAGTMATSVVEGPIVRGGLPSTYTGGTNAGPCFHGYGSGG